LPRDTVLGTIQAWNGNEVLALPIPWEKLFREQSQGEPVIWRWLRDVNRPDDR
jgi:hypothetical protein